MYGKHNVSGENLMYCLSCRSKAGYADTATVEGHGLPLEGGRAGFKVRVYFDRLCKIYRLFKNGQKNCILSFAQKKIFLPY